MDWIYQKTWTRVNHAKNVANNVIGFHPNEVKSRIDFVKNNLKVR